MRNWGWMMKIEKIQVKGFGILDECEFSQLSPHLTLLIGKNETGKTSLLEFLRRILFGFPRTNNNVNPYEPRNGGPKGGNLSILLNDGRGLKVTRLKGSKVNHENILFQDGSTQPITSLPSLIGNVSKNFFNRIFAITNSDLHQYGTLVDDQEIKGYLIGGATGLGSENPIKIKREIQERAEKIFIPNGRERLINQISNELNDINRKIREVQNNTEAYVVQKEQLVNNIKKRETLEEFEKTQQKENRKLDLIKRGLKDWNNIYLKRKKINELPKIHNLSQGSINQINKIDDELKDIQHRIEDIEDDIAIKQSKIKLSPLNQDILNNEQEILTVIRLKPKYQIERDELIKISTSISDKKNNLEQLFLDLGPKWNEEKLINCNLSHAALDNILSTSENYNLSKSKCDTLRLKLELLDNDIKILKQDVQKINSPLVENREKIHALSNRFAEYQQNVFETKKLKKKCETLSSEQKNLIGKIKSKWPDLILKNLPDYNIEKIQDTSYQYLSQIEKYENKKEELNRSILEKKGIYDSWNLKLTHQKKKIQDLGSVLSEKDIENYENALKKLKQLIQEKWSKNETKNVTSGWIVRPVFSGLLGLFGIILIIFGLIIKFIPSVYVGIALILFGGLWYLLISQLNSTHDNLGNTEKLDLEIKKYSDKLKFSKIPDLDEIAIKEKMIQKNYQKIKSYQIFSEQLEELEFESKQAKKFINLIEAELIKIEEEQKNCLKKIEAWYISNLISSTVELKDIPHFISITLDYKRISKEILTIKEEINDKFTSASQFLQDISDFLSSQIDFLKSNSPNDNPESDFLITKIRELKEESDNELLKEQRNQETNNKIITRNNEKSELETLLLRSEENNKEILQQFQKLLEKYGFDSETNPTQIHLQYKRILNTRDTLIAIKSDVEKEIKLRINCSLFEEKIRNLTFHLPDLNQGGEPENFIALLESHLVEQKERSRIHQENYDEIKGKTERLDQYEKKKTALQTDLDNIIKETGFSAIEEIELIKPTYFEQLKLKTEIEQHELNIFTLAGNEERYNQLIDELQIANPEEIDDKIDQTIQSLNQIRDELNIIIQKIAVLQNNCESLIKSEEHNQLLIKKNQLKEELKILAKEWAIYTLADSILQRALEKYEHERQPAVVSRAEKIFSQITGGGYTRLYMPVSNKEFEMEMQDGFIKTPSLLSQGTAEQLYLALRLAYAEEYCSHTEPLPIILDDILVNCDADRMKAAVNAIVELSKEIQVIYCTCHEPLIRCFKEAAPEMGVIELSQYC